MEFERALFQIHKRVLFSDGIRQWRFSGERLLPLLISVLVILLAILHWDHIGKANCLPNALQSVGLWNATTQLPELKEDTLLAVSVISEKAYWDDAKSFHERIHSQNRTVTHNPKFNGEPQNATEHGALIGRYHGHTIASYRFAQHKNVVRLTEDVIQRHKFVVVNVSINDHCLAPPFFMRGILRLVDAFDTIVINELAYTFRSDGFLDRFKGTVRVESWIWSAEQVEAAKPQRQRPLFFAFMRKIKILIRAIIASFLISASTGFFIRVAVNGSAAMMLPLIKCSQSFGANHMQLAAFIRIDRKSVV